MAMDEIIEWRSQQRFAERYPMIVRLAVSVSSNPRAIEAYEPNRVRAFVTRIPTECLGGPASTLCGNPACQGNAVDLIELIERRIGVGGARLRLTWMSWPMLVSRYQLDEEAPCGGSLDGGGRCDNLLGIRGFFETRI